MELVKIKHRPTFLYNYLHPAIKACFVAMAIPEKPNSSKQRYYLTEEGMKFFEVLKSKDRG